MCTQFMKLPISVLLVIAAMNIAGCEGTDYSAVTETNGNGTESSTPSPPYQGGVFESLLLVPWCPACVDATTATVTIDGELAVLSDLRAQELVLMHGVRTLRKQLPGFWEIADETPPYIDRVERTTLLQGPVESVDVQRSQLVVMGQFVQLLHTSIDSVGPVPAAMLSTVKVGDHVRVSGYRSTNDRILARRIDHVAAGEPARILGELQPGATFLHIGQLDIDVTNATLTGLPGGAREGEIVSVAGEYDESAQVLSATSLIAYDPFAAQTPGMLVTTEGLVATITEFRYPPEAQIAHVNARFRDESCEYDYFDWEWKPNQLWRLEGIAKDDFIDIVCYLGNSPFDAGEPSPPMGRRVEGPIESIDLDDQTLTVQGMTARLNFVTRFGVVVPEECCYYHSKPLSEITIGEWAVVSGFVGVTENVILAHTVTIGDDWWSY